ncbi:hypothetical protein CMV_022885 [Castanea mollissima]|uniref:Uncharacterized protein n=3 Tax=Castanea mollissima TaxID=60419 RepID=A0A8J4QIP9_9ROSI|nr:hypothetical protein CMV_022885 [Castanea mollissima]
MADSVVSFLLENLTQLLSQESKLLGGVEDQVRLLQNELSLIKIFLKNTEGKRHDNELVKEVVSQIRDVAYEAEDVIDTFIVTVTKHKKSSKLRRSKYGIEIAESSGGDAEVEEILHRRRRYVEEDQVVGFDHDTELLGLSPLPRVMLRAELKEKLLHGLDVTYSSKKPKGTLTEDSKLFKEMNERFKEMNDEEFRKAWSEFLESVQDHNDLKNSLSNFMQYFYSENGVKLKDMTEDELKSVLLESLKDKRYLLVMDDIWNIEVWNEVSTAFPNNSNRSRILITTRIKEVSLHASRANNSVPPILPYELPLLEEGFGGVVELESPPDNCYLEWICKSNKLVRVVDLSNMGICCLISKGIEKLVLLRYLSISSGELRAIPNSICNLWDLETLDMRNSTVKTICLPKGIWKLQRLRHLYLDGSTSLPRTRNNTAALPNLQVLTGIAINEDTESHFAKARFPNLRKLGLYSSRWVESGILSSLRPLCHLQTLKISQLYEIPSPTSISLTLTKITLVDSVLSTAIMGLLGSLTKLRILKVRRDATYRLLGIDLICDEGSFQQLEVFKMANLAVSGWYMGQGAMPKLQRLVIQSCKDIQMLPDELWCLGALRDVEISHPHPDLAERLRQLQMRDGCKLHVYPPLNPTN